jgi:acetyl-CoA acetyltransferase
MASHPYSNVVIPAVFNSRQGRVLDGYDSFSIALEAVKGVIAEAGLEPHDVDGFFGQFGSELAYTLGVGPVHAPFGGIGGIASVLDAANAVAAGLCSVAVVASGGAAIYRDRQATAPWTRPTSEFVVAYGLYTAAEFALIARRHMEVYGTKPKQLAMVAATIRNNGHAHPQAVYYGRGPFTPEDILASRMVAEPFHLLDCSMTAEGGCALLITTREKAKGSRKRPVHILGAGIDHFGPAYQHPPSWDLRSGDGEIPNGYVGRRAARQAFAMCGLGPKDVSVCEFYDPFSFEIIRQFEAFEFCDEGEGGPFVEEGNIGPGGRYPVTTDGGTMSFSHGGGGVQMSQRVIRGVQQLQGDSQGNQVPGASVALCTNGGAGALFTDVILLGVEAA